MADVAGNPIVFAYVAGRWRRDLSRHSSLMAALAERVPVVLLEGAERRKLPRPAPLRLERRSERLYVVHGVHRFQRSGLGRRMPNLAARLDNAALHGLLTRHGLGDYVLWAMHDSLRPLRR